MDLVVKIIMPYQRALTHRLGFEPGSQDYETTALPTEQSRYDNPICHEDFVIDGGGISLTLVCLFCSI